MQFTTNSKPYPVIKPCECGCRKLGLRCIRVGDEDPAPSEAARPENGMARRLP